MSVTANLTTNVETITATIVVEDETIIVQVSAAARGPAGEAGAAGPNEITTATTTNLTGFISGNGTNIAGATAAASAATANTLVLRDGNGGASFGPLSALAGSGNQHSITSSAGTNIVGPLALSGSTGDTLTATYNAAITLNSTTGVNVNGGPLTLTQTWTDAAVTYTGLQVNVTDSGPSNAASLLMDLRVGGVSRARVRKDGLLTCGAINATSSGSNFASITSSSTGVFLQSGGRLGISSTGYLGFSASGDATGALDLQILRDGAANTLAQRNGNAAQESRIYGTYTGPGNYRRLALKMDTAGVAQIVAEGGGAGAADNRLEFVTGGATRMTVAADGVVNVSGAVTAAGNVTLGTASAGSTLSFVPRSAQNITQVILSTAADEMIIGETGAGKRVIFGGGAQNNFMRSSGMSTTGLVVGSTSTAVSGVAYIAGTLGVGIAAPTTALDVVGSIKASGTFQTGGYTFANLPSPATQGMRTFITDGADIPLFMANASGGGSTVTPVFYNGTNWINA
jgi:hypothetical protein